MGACCQQGLLSAPLAVLEDDATAKEESEVAAMLQLGAHSSVEDSVEEEEDAVATDASPLASASMVDAAAPEAARYPPTLFSLANYQASCEGATARHLYTYQKDAGSLLYVEGIFLIGFAVVSTSIKLIGLCSPK